MMSRRTIFRRELLQALLRFAATDGEQLLAQIKASGRIVDVFSMGRNGKIFTT